VWLAAFWKVSKADGLEDVGNRWTALQGTINFWVPKTPYA
jgi:hypothetical protein